MCVLTSRMAMANAIPNTTSMFFSITRMIWVEQGCRRRPWHHHTVHHFIHMWSKSVCRLDFYAEMNGNFREEINLTCTNTWKEACSLWCFRLCPHRGVNAGLLALCIGGIAATRVGNFLPVWRSIHKSTTLQLQGQNNTRRFNSSGSFTCLCRKIRCSDGHYIVQRNSDLFSLMLL